jgi:hypothetical protein
MTRKDQQTILTVGVGALIAWWLYQQSQRTAVQPGYQQTFATPEGTYTQADLSALYL